MQQIVTCEAKRVLMLVLVLSFINYNYTSIKPTLDGWSSLQVPPDEF